MSGASYPSPGIPPPIDGDDDDVAWALQTSAVQWKRGAHSDAIVWLRRAVGAAIQAGHGPRAAELNRAAADLTEQILAQSPPISQSRPAEGMGGAEQRPNVPTSVSRPPMPTSVEVDLEGMEPTRQIEASPAEVTKVSPLPSGQGPVALAPPLTQVSAQRSEPPTSAGPPIWGSAAQDPSSRTAATLTRPPSASASPRSSARPAATSTRPPSAAPWARLSSRPPPMPSAPPPPVAPRAAPAGDRKMGISVAGVALGLARGLQDLPEDAQLELAAQARLQTLGVDEEIGSFAVALVVEGWVSVMPTIADVVCTRAAQGEVVFTQGTLEDGVLLRVVAGENGATLALWDRAALEKATADCPWVADELRAVADRYQAVAGVAMGPLGERLDDELRAQVTDRCEVHALLPREFVFAMGQPVTGIHIVGAGRVELVEDDGEGATVRDELGPGDVLFSHLAMASGPAPATARAGKTGALLLSADRHVAHELMVSVPPLLEFLAS